MQRKKGHHHAGPPAETGRGALRSAEPGTLRRARSALAGPRGALAPATLRVGPPSAALPAATAVRRRLYSCVVQRGPQAHYAGRGPRTAPSRPHFHKRWAGSRLASPGRPRRAARSSACLQAGSAPHYSVVAGRPGARCQARRGRGCPAPAGPAGNQPGCRGTRGERGVWAQCAPPGPAPLRDLSFRGLPTPPPPGRGGW